MTSGSGIEHRGEVWEPMGLLWLLVWRDDVHGVSDLIRDHAHRFTREALRPALLMPVPRPSMAELLIYYGADVNYADEEGTTPLHKCYSADVAECLLAHGADLASTDQYVQTPLHIKTSYSGVALVLLEYGAKSDARNNAGCTPLHCAALYQDRTTDEIYGFYDKEPDIHLMAPMRAAAQRERVRSMRYLVRFGANVNAQDDGRDTPLHYAAINCFHLGAEELLSSGADPSIKNHDGQAALDVARESPDNPVTELLLRHSTRTERNQ